jgi:hypothetical protein
MKGYHTIHHPATFGRLPLPAAGRPAAVPQPHTIPLPKPHGGGEEVRRDLVTLSPAERLTKRDRWDRS